MRGGGCEDQRVPTSDQLVSQDDLSAGTCPRPSAGQQRPCCSGSAAPSDARQRAAAAMTLDSWAALMGNDHGRGRREPPTPEQQIVSRI
jgi:hypothetical protein